MTLGYKIGAGVLIGVALVTTIVLISRHYTSLVDAKVALTAQVETLEQDVAREQGRVEALKASVDKWDGASGRQAEALSEFAEAQRDAGKHAREIRNALSQHDLGALAKAKPGLIEPRINAGTADAFRLLEQSSEAPGAGRD